MVVRKLALFLSALVIAVGFGGSSPTAADETDCYGSPSDAVTVLPAPLRKWGHIVCTRFGHMLESREGWVWAWLDGSGAVAIPSQMVRRNPRELGNDSYFVTVDIADLEPEALVFALSMFHDALNMDEGQVKGYRVTLKSVSGRAATVYFLDFEKFAGGMLCPEDACVPQTQFMIMERDHAADERAAST